MRVYYVGSGYAGCYYVRCLLPLQANGWDGDTTYLTDKEKDNETKMRAISYADIVVFHRPMLGQQANLMLKLKKMGKKVVFDNDDTFMDTGGFRFTSLLEEERLKRGLDKINVNLNKAIGEADLVTCSTEFLKEEYSKISDKVIVLPNCVDPFDYPDPLKNTSEEVRIGIVGSVGITDDYILLKPIIEHFIDDKRIKFVLFCMPNENQDSMSRQLYKEEYEFWDKVENRIEWHRFVPMRDYFNTLNNLRLDFMIIPRKNNYFNRCKSNLKFLEASMLEVPVIGQSFSTNDSPYQQNNNDTKYMLLADSNDEWIAQINKLVEDKQLRISMGKAAREYVEETYSIEKNAHKWVEAYKIIL